MITEKNKSVAIADRDWVLAEPLLVRKGYVPDETNSILVRNISDITSDLREWGIPWQWSC